MLFFCVSLILSVFCRSSLHVIKRHWNPLAYLSLQHWNESPSYVVHILHLISHPFRYVEQAKKNNEEKWKHRERAREKKCQQQPCCRRKSDVNTWFIAKTFRTCVELALLSHSNASSIEHGIWIRMEGTIENQMFCTNVAFTCTTTNSRLMNCVGKMI